MQPLGGRCSVLKRLTVQERFRARLEAKWWPVDSCRAGVVGGLKKNIRNSSAGITRPCIQGVKERSCGTGMMMTRISFSMSVLPLIVTRSLGGGCEMNNTGLGAVLSGFSIRENVQSSQHLHLPSLPTVSGANNVIVSWSIQIWSVANTRLVGISDTLNYTLRMIHEKI